MISQTKHLISKYRFYIFSLTIFGVLIDIFFLDFYSDLLDLFLLLFWIISIINYKFKSSISGIIAIVFVTLTPLLLLINEKNKAEKAAVWAFFFLTVVVLQQIKISLTGKYNGI